VLGSIAGLVVWVQQHFLFLLNILSLPVVGQVAVVAVVVVDF